MLRDVCNWDGILGTLIYYSCNISIQDKVNLCWTVWHNNNIRTLIFLLTFILAFVILWCCTKNNHIGLGCYIYIPCYISMNDINVNKVNPELDAVLKMCFIYSLIHDNHVWLFYLSTFFGGSLCILYNTKFSWDLNFTNLQYQQFAST